MVTFLVVVLDAHKTMKCMLIWNSTDASEFQQETDFALTEQSHVETAWPTSKADWAGLWTVVVNALNGWVERVWKWKAEAAFWLVSEDLNGLPLSWLSRQANHAAARQLNTLLTQWASSLRHSGFAALNGLTPCSNLFRWQSSRSVLLGICLVLFLGFAFWQCNSDGVKAVSEVTTFPNSKAGSWWKTKWERPRCACWVLSRVFMSF